MRVPALSQVDGVMLFVTKRQEPSARRQLTPPECLLRAEYTMLSDPLVQGAFTEELRHWSRSATVVLGVYSVENRTLPCSALLY